MGEGYFLYVPQSIMFKVWGHSVERKLLDPTSGEAWLFLIVVDLIEFEFARDGGKTMSRLRLAREGRRV